MDKNTAQAILSNTKAEKTRELLEHWINSERNEKIQLHKDYYDNQHWLILDNNRANRTRSGKWVWGNENKVQDAPVSIKEHRKSLGQGSDGLLDGQLRTVNYIKLFIQVYQDFITGTSREELVVTANTDDQLIQDALYETWGDIRPIVKTLLAQMLISTVGVTKTLWNGEQYEITEVDAQDFYPIYENKKLVGGAEMYYIDAEVAKLKYGDIKTIQDCEDDQVSYVDMYLQEGEQVTRYEIVHGYVMEPQNLIDEDNLQPFDMVANIDHAFRNYSETSLEDSEIFSWIDDNDAINANETIAFVVNLIMASPKYTIDGAKAEALGVNIQSLAFKQAMEKFSPFLGQLTELPIELVAGQSVPDSFYNNLERMERNIMRDAGIPSFLISGEGISNISEETIKEGMSILNRKLEQKKQQLHKLIQDVSRKILKKLNVDADGLEISINWLELGGLSTKQLLEHYVAGFQAGLYPKEYTYMKTLELVGHPEDFDQVKEMDLAQGSELLGQIERQAEVIRTGREQETAEQLERERQQQATALQQAQTELEQLI